MTKALGGPSGHTIGLSHNHEFINYHIGAICEETTEVHDDAFSRPMMGFHAKLDGKDKA